MSLDEIQTMYSVHTAPDLGSRSARCCLFFLALWHIVTVQAVASDILAPSSASQLMEIGSLPTDDPGPIPARYDVLNKTYLESVDQSHLPRNASANRLPKDSCTGSHYCTWTPWFSKKADSRSCEIAYSLFDQDLYFERYVSFFWGMLKGLKAIPVLSIHI